MSEMILWLAQVFHVTVATVSFNNEDDRLLRLNLPPEVELISARPCVDDCSVQVPQSFRWAWSHCLATQIAAAHRKSPFQLAIASHSYAFPYVATLASVTTVVDAHNIEYRIHEQFSMLHAGQRSALRMLAGSGGDGFGDSVAEIKEFEWTVWRHCDVVLSVSEVDRTEIRARTGERSVLLVPNGVTSSNPSGAIRNHDRPTVSFVGALNYIPNIDAVLQLASSVAMDLRSSFPDVRVLVAGRDPTPQFSDWCTQRGVEVVPNPPNMDDVIRGTILACPLRMGSGSRIKILEARRAGVPVLASSIAVEGLHIEDDPGVVVCDDNQIFRTEVIKWLRTANVHVPLKCAPSTWGDSFQPLLSLTN